MNETCQYQSDVDSVGMFGRIFRNSPDEVLIFNKIKNT